MIRFSLWVFALFASVLLIGAGPAAAQVIPASGQGQTCGGIAGFQCAGGLVCIMTGARHPDQAGTCEAPNGGGHTVCPQIFQPVCGTNGVTYPNLCVATVRGATAAHPGQCRAPPPKVCPRLWRPVCGEDGRTYANRCTADAAGVAVAQAGRCGTSPPGDRQPSPYPAAPIPYQPPPYAAPPAPHRPPYGERG